MERRRVYMDHTATTPLAPGVLDAMQPYLTEKWLSPAGLYRGARALRRELEGRGIIVRCPSAKGLAEEAPLAYKDVDRVVRVVEQAGLARRVARLVPIGVVKG